MKDYKHTSGGDLDLSHGDLQVTESTDQHQRDLLLSDQGHIRQKPEAGVGAVNYLLGGEAESFLRSARKEFSADGMKVRKIAFASDGMNLTTEAAYEND